MKRGRIVKQIAQNYKTGELSLLDVPVPANRPGGVLVRTLYSVISSGTELMKVSESRLSLVGKARARPDQVRKVLQAVRQQGLKATYQKVMNKLDALTPLGYSLAGEVISVGDGADEFRVGDTVACGGNKYALHAEYNWVPVNLCVPVPAGVPMQQAAFATIASIAMQGVRQSELKLGETACVIGLGLLGQILVQLLNAGGIRVVGLDLAEDRCKLAESLGAVRCGVPSGEGYQSVLTALCGLTSGAGADCIFLCSGGKSNDPVLAAAELVRDRGRVVDVGKTRLDLPWNAYYEKEIDVRFSRSYGPGRYDPVYEEHGIDYPVGYVRWTERRNMACIIDMLAHKQLDFAPLISKEVDFSDSIDTYNALDTGEASGIGFVLRYGGVPSSECPAAAKPVKPTTTGKVRLGVIGCGNYTSSMLMPHLAADKDVDLVEVVTNTGLSAADAQRKFGFARISTDSAVLLADPNIDAVLIGTRHSSHPELVARALRAGKAVFVEKPLAIDAAGLDLVRDAVRECGNDRLMVGYNRRFSPLLGQMRDAWGRSAGPVVINYRINAGGLDKNSWYLDRLGEGSRFAGEGCHFVDTVSWWLGSDPVAVVGSAKAAEADNLVVTYLYPDGSVATISYLTQGEPRFPKELIEVSGGKRTAVFHNFEHFEVWRDGKVTKARSGVIDKGQKAEMRAFVAAVKSGEPMPVSFDSLVATSRFTLAAQLAATAEDEGFGPNAAARTEYGVHEIV